MPDKDLAGAELVPVWAAGGWLGNPVPARCSDQLTLRPCPGYWTEVPESCAALALARLLMWCGCG